MRCRKSELIFNKIWRKGNLDGDERMRLRGLCGLQIYFRMEGTCTCMWREERGLVEEEPWRLRRNSGWLKKNPGGARSIEYIVMGEGLTWKKNPLSFGVLGRRWETVNTSGREIWNSALCLKTSVIWKCRRWAGGKGAQRTQVHFLKDLFVYVSGRVTERQR